MKYLFIVIILICLPILSGTISFANDCVNMHKKCKNPDKSFKISSSSRSIKMRKGKKVRIILNAYGGREYFFSTYSKPKVGTLQFRIINSADNKILYDNSTEGLIDTKTFKVETTKKLFIEVLAPNWQSEKLYECAGFQIAYKNINLFKTD